MPVQMPSARAAAEFDDPDFQFVLLLSLGGLTLSLYLVPLLGEDAIKLVSMVG